MLRPLTSCPQRPVGEMGTHIDNDTAKWLKTIKWKKGKGEDLISPKEERDQKRLPRRHVFKNEGILPAREGWKSRPGESMSKDRGTWRYKVGMRKAPSVCFEMRKWAWERSTEAGCQRLMSYIRCTWCICSTMPYGQKIYVHWIVSKQGGNMMEFVLKGLGEHEA